MSTVKAINLQHPTSSNANIVMDSSGRVGIGNNAPLSSLHVAGPATGTNPIIRVNATSLGSEPFQWLSSALAPLANSQNFVHIFGKSESAYNTGYIGYKHSSDGSALNSVTLGLYASDNLLNVYAGGQVTKPNQPMFQVSKDNGGSAFSGGQTITWNIITSNIGSGYNASTGRFTAPISGRYFFSCHVLGATGGTDSGQSFVFNVNDSSSGFQPYTRTTGAQYVGYGGTIILQLNAGDYVTVYLQDGSIYAQGAKHNGFCGYLLG